MRFAFLSSVIAALALVVSTSSTFSQNNLYVGSNSSFVTNNFTTGTNTYDEIFMGYRTNDSNNTINVYNPNTLLVATTNLVVGLYGTANRLLISNGGKVASDFVVFSPRALDVLGNIIRSSNNSALVTGADSVMSARTIQLGGIGGGGGNCVVISNGGKIIVSENSLVGSGSSHNNTVLVTESGSVWSNGSRFWIGYGNASSNSLIISNGGSVISRDASIGWFFRSNNLALVTGAGSLWTISNDLEVLGPTTDTGLVVTNGGEAVVGMNLRMSAGSITVGGGVLRVTNGAIDIGSANNSLSAPVGFSVLSVISGTVQAAQLFATNGSNSVIDFKGGTLVSRSTAVSNETDFIVGNSGNSATFIADGGTHNFRNGLIVGSSGAANRLVISNSATVAAAFTDLGRGSSNSSSNNMLVTGSNSTLTSGSFFIVGSAGGANSLVVSNGARVLNTDGYVGFTNTSGNNALVTGAGSVWSNSNLLTIGVGGSGNMLMITDGGSVFSASGLIGSTLSTSNSSILVSGTNSLWQNSGNITINRSGSSLTVASGGRVAAPSITIASDANSSATMNIGRLGTNDAAGIIDVSSISFGAGAGSIQFNQSNAVSLSSIISGAGTIRQLGSGTTTLTASNSYSGGTLVSAGVFRLAPSGALTFRVGSNGAVNSVTNNARCEFQGAFEFDLSTASTNVGDVWSVVVTGGGATSSYGPSFTLPSFRAYAPGVWLAETRGVLYRYNQAAGALTCVGSTNNDSDSDGLNDAAENLLQDLGFNWTVPQTNQVSALFNYANFAGLYTSSNVSGNPSAFNLFTQDQFNSNRTAGQSDVINNPMSYGLYTSNSIMDLRMGGLMIQKVGTNAVISFQPQTTTDLTQPFTNNGAPITNEIPMPGNKGFLRIQAGPQPAAPPALPGGFGGGGGGGGGGG